MPWLLSQAQIMPPSATPATSNTPKATITPPQDSFAELLLYAVPRFSDFLRRMTDIKNSAASRKLKMSPSTGLWLTLALIGVIISANSYFVGLQNWFPDADTITTVIPLGRDDVAFRPMALFPPMLFWLSKVVNFSMWVVGGVIPDVPLAGGSPQWNPAERATVYSNATLALAWWIGAAVSVLISSTQGLFTRTTSLGKQREYAQRLNAIARIELSPKAISPARREVRKANHWGSGAVWGMCLIAVAGWAWEMFVADGALSGTSFDSKAWWIYTLSSTFLAELCWFIAGHSGKKINPDI